MLPDIQVLLLTDASVLSKVFHELSTFEIYQLVAFHLTVTLLKIRIIKHTMRFIRVIFYMLEVTTRLVDRASTAMLTLARADACTNICAGRCIC